MRLRIFLSLLLLASSPIEAQMVISHSVSDVIVPGHSVNCGLQGVHEDTGIWRTFDLPGQFGITTGFCVEKIKLGIQEALAPCTQPVTIRLYADDDTVLAPTTSLVLLAKRTVELSNQQLATIEIEIGAQVPPGDRLVVEIFTPSGLPASGTRFFVGSNQSGETAPSYLRAPTCSVPEPVPLLMLGHPDVHMLLSVVGNPGPCSCLGPQDLIATQVPGTNDVTVTWTPQSAYHNVELSIDGVLVTTVPGTTTSALLPLAGSFGTQVEVMAHGVIAGVPCPGASSAHVALIPPIPLAPSNYPMTVGLPLVHGAAPVLATIAVPDVFSVGLVQVKVDISHDQMADLAVNLTGPTGTTVTLHNNSFFDGGFYQPDLHVTFADAGIGSCFVPPTCNCLVKPWGPGTLADFRCSPSQGNWTLVALDLFPFNDGTLDSWRLELSPLSGQCCPAPTNLAAVSDCFSDSVRLTWTANSVYSQLEIFHGGLSIAVLPGSATDFEHASPGTGLHEYSIVAQCGVFTNPPVTTSTFHTSPAGETDVVLALEGLASIITAGQINGAQQLAAALTAAGRTVQVVPLSPLDYPCLDQVESLWVLAGTFPDDYRLTLAEADQLADLNLNGVALYLESGDHWGFNHLPTLLDDRDGVDTAAMIPDDDGDDSFTLMNGFDSGLGLDLSDLVGITYSQDQTSSDFTDRLRVATNDAGGPLAAALWRNSPDMLPAPVPEGSYVTGILHRNDVGGHMIVQSWELGGFMGNRSDLVARYLGAMLGSHDFQRGDCNDDGQINLADAVTLLNYLFPGNNPASPLHCANACDTNDDGTQNISDAISSLSALFGSPAIPLPPPATCAPDPTVGVLTCLRFDSCP